MRAVCYFGIHDPSFSRTVVIKKGLSSQGITVYECNDRTPSLKKYWNLIKQHQALKGKYDVMIVSFPGYFVVFLARLITRKPIIFDAYISYYDGIADRNTYPSYHPRLLAARFVDWASARCAAVVLTINEAYKQFFIDYLKVSARKMEVLHKGADEAVFRPLNSGHTLNSKVKVGWWGTFIPLHGLPYILEAAKLLRDDDRISFELYGRGQLSASIEETAARYGLRNLRILPPVSRGELVNKISEIDIALGIFSPLPKAQRCVTNKVYEALACGKAVITEESPANREIFTHLENAYLVKPGDVEALAQAIIRLSTDTELRGELGRNALALFENRFTTEYIGKEFMSIVTRHGF